MRAKEFVINVNVPIKIKINGDGEPEIDVDNDSDEPELDQNPVMVSPLQQDLELKKANIGKTSTVISKMVDG